MSDTKSAPERGIEDTTAWTGSPMTAGQDTASDALCPGDTVGRYQVRGLLGAGGMGQVFTAFDPELGRTVALKLIHPDGGYPSARARTRLLREAQALAKLQHPNVVTIHDVGTKDNQVFIAMELIAGQTLTAWLGATERPWRAIRDVFVAAGRGLAAAHAVGIVHRDFKPGNVIVGEDRVVVVDFGLARAHDGQLDHEESEPNRPVTMLDVSLTLTGERVGTPRYMAPEQHVGDPVGALADQFAFATSLWAALYGSPPFAGETRAEVLHAMATGPAPPPADRKVPERVRAALARALALRPGDRWPALVDLLAELSHDPAAARRRLFAIVAVSVAAIAAPVAYVAGRQTPAPSCAAPATGLWGETDRAELRSAFLATHAPFAGDSFERVDAALRARLAAWAAAHEEACAATEIRHEQSAALMDARMGCLGRARDQIAAFVQVLRNADARGVERATSAAPTIGDLDACDDVSTLTSVLPPPRDPKALAAIDELEREVARVDSLMLVGRVKEAMAAGPSLIARARELGHPPLLARGLWAVGNATCQAGEPRDGAAVLYQAARAASAAHDDLLVARTYNNLVYCVGNRDQNPQAGAALAEAAEAALARAGTPLEPRARLYRQESGLRRLMGDFIGAFAYAQLALVTFQRLYGEEHAEVARSRGELAGVLLEIGAFRAALTMYASALPILERTRGPTHPYVATYLANMAGAAGESGDLTAAVEGFERAMAMEEQNYGPDHAGKHHLLRNLANVRERQGQLEAARELAQRALALDEKTRRPDHPDLAFDMFLLCHLAIDRGDLAEAQTLCDKALAIRLAAYGPDHTDVADVHVLQAMIAWKRHDLAGARRLIDQALAATRKALGPRHPSVADDECVLGAILLEAGEAAAAVPVLEEALAIEADARSDDANETVVARTLLAEALLATGKPDRAIALAERAVAAATERGLRADIDGRARFALARALDTADGPRALDLARQARALLVGSPAADQVVRVDRWLARR